MARKRYVGSGRPARKAAKGGFCLLHLFFIPFLFWKKLFTTHDITFCGLILVLTIATYLAIGLAGYKVLT